MHTNEENSDKSVEHSVNILPDPLKDGSNPAHAIVTVMPDFFGSNNKKKKAFKLLRIALARLATEKGWVLEPNAM